MSNELARSGDWKIDSESYFTAVGELESAEGDIDLVYGGLVDLDVTFDLIKRRLQLAVVLVRHPDRRDEEEKIEHARKAAVDGVLRLERLVNANLSLDQGDVITEDPRMEELHDLLSELIFFGGASLFEARADPKATKRVVRIVTAAFVKHSAREDLASEGGTAQAADSGLEIERGEEDLIFADSMMLPVSQAALMVREEIIPTVEEELAADPGNAELQDRLEMLHEQAEIFEKTRFFPRARPIEMEPGLLTEAIVGYTPGGEAIVRMKIPVISSTGNRLDRIRETVESEILRDVVGTGISPELDEEFRAAMSPQSGRKGSSDDALSALRADDLFRKMSVRYPFLKRLYDPDEMAKLVEYAEKGQSGSIRAYLTSAAETDRNLLAGESGGELGPGQDEEA